MRRAMRLPGFLSRLDDDTRQELLTMGAERRFRDGQSIHRAGKLDRSLQIILEGEVGFSRLDKEGREISLAVLAQGDAFGHIPLLTGEPRTHDATAIGNVRLLNLTLKQFREVLLRRPDIRDHVLAHLAEALARALDTLDETQRFSVAERVARFLLRQAQETAHEQTVHLRQDDIAAELSVTREAVAIVLRKFRRDGLIETGYRSITLLDIPALRQACE